MQRKVIRTILIIGAAVAAWGTISFALWLRHVPDVENLRKANPRLTLTVKNASGGPMSWPVGTANPSWTPLSEVADCVPAAVIASEDDSFFSHSGFDFDEIKDAVKTDIKKRRFARGASTLTMQLAKNLYLTKEKTISRKLKEAYLSYRIEDELSKRRILELYLNIVEWGPGVYGIKDAASFYFGKLPSELTPNEAAALAVILPNPRYLNLYERPEKSEKKRVRILGKLLKRGNITQADFDAAIAAPPRLKNAPDSAADAADTTPAPAEAQAEAPKAETTAEAAPK